MWTSLKAIVWFTIPAMYMPGYSFISMEEKINGVLTVFTTWTLMALFIKAKAFFDIWIQIWRIGWWWLKYPLLINFVMMTPKIPVKYYPTCRSISSKTQNSPHNFTPEITSLLVIAKSIEVFFNFFLLCFLYPNWHKRH